MWHDHVALTKLLASTSDLPSPNSCAHYEQSLSFPSSILKDCSPIRLPSVIPLQFFFSHLLPQQYVCLINKDFITVVVKRPVKFK